MTHSQAAQLAPIEIALAVFRQKFPTFDTTQSLDTLRATEYARLDAQQHVYLDYTGGGLYAAGICFRVAAHLCANHHGLPAGADRCAP